MLSTVSEAKTILVNFYYSKEGKTFISVNLAATLRLLAKKYCLLVWILEIKVRCLFRYTRTRLKLFSIQVWKYRIWLWSMKGMKIYMCFQQGIFHQTLQNYDGGKVDTLFNDLKIWLYRSWHRSHGLVTDTLLVAKHADCFIYVARANFFKKRMLGIVTFIRRRKICLICVCC
jgi:hypothetical protein